MVRQTATKENTKLSLLEKGIEIMIEKGYNNTGIQEVLQATGVPKGSFYYYFSSKEEFGLQIIDHFEESCSNKFRRLDDSSITPLARLRKYCEESRQSLESQNCRKGCLIGNLSQEMADQSEAFRSRLEEVFSRWRNKLAACLQEGQKLGEINADIDSVELAEFFLSAWEGSVMRAKISKTTASQQAFIHIMFDKILKP